MPGPPRAITLPPQPLILDLVDEAEPGDELLVLDEVAAVAPTVLLVEDDDALRHLWAARLSYAGWRVHEAADGNAARVLAEGERPDIVISDVHMPRATGWDLLVAVQRDRLLRGTPVVLISADDLFVENAATANLGAAMVMSKSQLRGDDIVVHARNAAFVPLDFIAQLARGEALLGDVWTFAVARMLSLLARAGMAGAEGRLVVEAVLTEPAGAVARYELHVKDGELVTAGVYVGGAFETDSAKVVERLVDEPSGRFHFQPARVAGHGTPIRDVLAAAAANSPIDSVASIAQLQGGRFVVDPKRYALYQRLAQPDEAMRAQMIASQPTLFDAIAKSSSPIEADRMALDLLRKGVLRLTGP